MNTTANAAPGAAVAATTTPDYKEAVIDCLAIEKHNAKRNKKGARVVAAFDVLEDLVIARADGEDTVAVLDKYIDNFKP
jgi:hypothetical protein